MVVLECMLEWIVECFGLGQQQRSLHFVAICPALQLALLVTNQRLQFLLHIHPALGNCFVCERLPTCGGQLSYKQAVQLLPCFSAVHFVGACIASTHQRMSGKCCSNITLRMPQPMLLLHVVFVATSLVNLHSSQAATHHVIVAVTQQSSALCSM